MAIKIVSFAAYLSTIDLQWRGVDHDAHDFVKGLKGESFKGYASIKVCGKYQRLTGENLDHAITWFGLMASAYLLQTNNAWPVTFVPIPNTSSVVGGPPPRTLRLATAIETALSKSSVADLFRWKEKFPSAHQHGGTRDPALLCKNLQMIDSIPKGQIILVDDVLTSGGHVQACAAVLAKGGGELLLTICGGRTVYSQRPDPFDVTIEELPEFTP